MKRLCYLLLAIALSGCALFSKDRLATKQIVSCANANKTIEASCNAAVDAVEKANILAASINTGIDDSLNARTLTKAQAQAYRDRTKQADTALDAASKAIKDANYSIALNQATVTKALLEAMNREIASEIAKGQK